MRPLALKVVQPAKRPGVRSKARGLVKRERPAQRLSLDWLEPRTLLATLPPVVLDPTKGARALAASGSQSSPTIAVDPVNSQLMVAVWTQNGGSLAGTLSGNPGQTGNGYTTSYVGAAYSVDGGTNWTAFDPTGGVASFYGGVALDVTTLTATPPTPYVQVSDGGVAFDRNHNFYVLMSQRKPDSTAGVLMLEKFQFQLQAGVYTPVQTISDKRIYEWGNPTSTFNQYNYAINPVIAVDQSVPGFVDPTTNVAQSTNFNGTWSNNVYIAWSGVDIPNGFTPDITYNPFVVRIIGSSDGGQNFTGQTRRAITTVNDSRNGLNPDGSLSRTRDPRLTVSQGTSDGSVPSGQVNVVWDDWASLNGANPPQDLIQWSPVTATLFNRLAATLPGTGVTLTDAVDPGNSLPHIPATTTTNAAQSINVNLATTDPRWALPNVVIENLQVEVAINHPAISELRVRLIPPAASGLQPITLLDNNVTAANATKGTGATGAGLGFPFAEQGTLRGTVFWDSTSAASIVGNAGGGASLGVFRPSYSINNAPNGPFPPPTAGATGEGAAAVGTFSLLTDLRGLTAARVQGQWSLEITDFRAGNVGTLRNFALRFTAGIQNPANPTQITRTLTDGTDVTVATSTVRGQTSLQNTALYDLTYPLKINASPFLGVGPGASVAADNTLGSYSQNAGTIYVAYTDKFDPIRDGITNPPADNTDIFFASVVPLAPIRLGAPSAGAIPTPLQAKLNDDSAQQDGNTQSVLTPTFTTGRPQFEPQVAVDQTTGTVAVSYLDGRDDPTGTRVATYVATSLDGGGSFGKQTYVNAPNLAFDPVTGKNVVLGPVPANIPNGGDALFSQGPRQGLAIFDGRIYAAYASDWNGGGGLAATVSAALTAAGPRVVSSTMGVVGEPGDRLNTQRTATNAPEASSLVVSFDRFIDPASFTTGAGAPETVLNSYDFESGVQGWTRTPNTAANLWHRTTTGRSTATGHTGPASFYYGLGETATAQGNYNTGNVNTGTLTSPIITLPVDPVNGTGAPLRQIYLRFKYLLGTDKGSPNTDIASVTIQDVDPATGNATTDPSFPITLASNNPSIGGLADTAGAFTTANLDLTQFAGRSVKISFRFNSVNALNNLNEGWYVDDVAIVQPATPPDVQILYTALDGTQTLLPTSAILAVTPLDPTRLNPSVASSTTSATTFRIDFTPQAGPGTYSYAIGPNINDRIRWLNPTGQTVSGNLMDQNADAIQGASYVPTNLNAPLPDTEQLNALKTIIARADESRAAESSR